MHLGLDQISPSAYSDPIDLPTAICETQARSSLSVQSTRHGSQQYTKHGPNTWPSFSRTRRPSNVFASEKTCHSEHDAIVLQPRFDSILPDGRRSLHEPMVENLNGDSALQGLEDSRHAPDSSFTESKHTQESTKHHSHNRALKKSRKNAVGLRDTLFRRRLRLKEDRNALQEERIGIVDSETHLIASVRQILIDSVLSQHPVQPDSVTEFEKKVAALEVKRKDFSELQFAYDEAEADINHQETELDEEEQNFEALLSDVLGCGESSDDSAPSVSAYGILRDSQQQTHNEESESPSKELDRAHFLTSRLRTKSDSALTTIREVFPLARPRINWWILHTFGCSPIDYVQRARDQAMLRDLNDVALDDESWAKLVFDYWRQEKELEGSPEISVDSWSNLSTHTMPEPRHVRRLTVGGSYLLLSSEISKARYTVDNYNHLFPADTGEVQCPVEADAISKDLDNLCPPGKQVGSPASAPAILTSPEDY